MAGDVDQKQTPDIRLLERTRERGFGVTDQEMIDGLRAVASPIFDHHGTPIAGLSIWIRSLYQGRMQRRTDALA